MTDLVKSAELVFRGVVSTPLGLTFEHPLSALMWDELMKTVLATRNASQWWLGDVLLKGDEWFGEEMAHYLELRHVSEITVKNVMRVCKVFPVARRRADLSFSHHMEVAGFETEIQDRLLKLASEKDLNRDQMRSLAKQVRDDAKLIQGKASGRISDEAEDAETVEDDSDADAKLAREPSVIDGTAQEVETETSPEANIAPVEGDDLFEVLKTTWAACALKERRAFFLWCMEDLGPLASQDEVTHGLAVVDVLDDDQEFQAKAGDDVLQGLESTVAPDNRSEAPDKTELVSRVDVGRTASATSETKDVTARRDGQPISPPSAPVFPADEEPEMPEFLRRQEETVSE